jgi:glyoxylase-like metal-dependent hydrolase (beta-lactamase superfamily II)
MSLKVFVLGPLNTNSYLLWDRGEAVIIDPGGEPGELISFIKSSNLNLKYVISTHGHFDHVLGVKELVRITGAKFYLNFKDVDLMPLFYDWREKPPAPHDDLRDGQEFRFGSQILQAVSTPGHTMGSTSLLWGGKMFTGDTLFKGTVGRYDLGGDREVLRETLEKLKGMDINEIYPGHGDTTSLKEELKSNPFLNGVVGPDDW